MEQAPQKLVIECVPFGLYDAMVMALGVVRGRLAGWLSSGSLQISTTVPPCRVGEPTLELHEMRKRSSPEQL